MKTYVKFVKGNVGLNAVFFIYLAVPATEKSVMLQLQKDIYYHILYAVVVKKMFIEGKDRWWLERAERMYSIIVSLKEKTYFCRFMKNTLHCDLFEVEFFLPKVLQSPK